MKGFCVEVSGRFACFTRPEMKVERVSYDVITPSAARAIYDAIFWKPAIRWKIKRIDVLNPIRWTSFRRNEVKSIASPKSSGIIIEEDHLQRAGLFLRDVRYRLYAEFEFIPVEKRQKTKHSQPERSKDSEEDFPNPQDENEAKYAAIFDRRIRKGQYFMHPYLGCREFSCDEIRLVEEPEREEQQPIHETRDLGFMLYDLDFSDPQNIKPMFYRPKMTDGVILVPDIESEEVYR